jgi:hypothetical protein
VLRDDWTDPGYWRWLWGNRVPTEAKVGLGAAAAFVMAVVGYVAAYGLASDAEASGARLVPTTVARVVTVRTAGRIERRTVPDVRTVRVAADASHETRREVALGTVTTPGGERVVATTVQRRVVATGEGRTVTVGRTVTDRRTVTEQRTVVQTQTQTVTGPPVTQVVTQTVMLTLPVTLPITVTVGLP